jgi:hypothetical protein
MPPATGKTIDAAELAPDYRRYPIDDHGKMRYAYGKATVPVGGIAANATIGLLFLPPGRKRLILPLSRIAVSAFGAGRTLRAGHDAYMKREPREALEPADDDAFLAGLDVSAAVASQQLGVPPGSPLKFDMYSLEETLVFATVLGGTAPAAATVEMLLAYLYE